MGYCGGRSRAMHRMVVGERLPVIGTVLRYSDGRLLPLETGVEAVRFRMFRPGRQVTGPFQVDADVQDRGDNGQAVYTWQEGDTDDPGLWYARWVVTFTDPEVADMTFPSWGFDEVFIST